MNENLHQLPDDLRPPSRRQVPATMRAEVTSMLDQAPTGRRVGLIAAPVLALALIGGGIAAQRALTPPDQVPPAGSPSASSVLPSKPNSSSVAPSSAPSAPSTSAPVSTAGTKSASTSPKPAASSAWPTDVTIPPVANEGDWVMRTVTGAELTKRCLSEAAESDFAGAKVRSTSPNGLVTVVANGDSYSACDGHLAALSDGKNPRVALLRPAPISRPTTDARHFHISQRYFGDEMPDIRANMYQIRFFAAGPASGLKSVQYSFTITVAGKAHKFTAPATLSNGYWTMDTLVDVPNDWNGNATTVKATVVTTSGRTVVHTFTQADFEANQRIYCRQANFGC